VKITKTTVDELAFILGKSNQQLYWDEEQPGFGVRVTRSAKSYFVEHRVGGKTRRVTLGRHGKLTAEQARKKAKAEIGKLALGEDPVVEKAKRRERSVTLREAFDAYLSGRKGKGGKKQNGLKPLTVKDYEKAVDESFGDWMHKPIQSISVEMIRTRYARRVKASPARANNGMRVLRAVLRDAAAEVQDRAAKADLQSVVREALQNRWAKVERRKTVIKAADLPAWIKAVLELSNHHPQARPDVVSDYLVFCLLTGCRREEAAGLQWADVDMKARAFTLRDTKNRDDHTLPMTDWLEDMFKRRKSEAERTRAVRSSLDSKQQKAVESAATFVFPGEGKSGHLVEPRKQMVRIMKATGVMFCVHDLRRTFSSMAEAIGIGQYTLKRLMNHKVGTDVTAGYVVLDVDNLREPMQRITDFVLKAAGVKHGADIVTLPATRRSPRAAA
jgi:integrase